MLKKTIKSAGYAENKCWHAGCLIKNTMNNRLALLITTATGLAALPTAAFAADIVMTYAQAPGLTNSTLAGTSVFTFNGFANGTHLTNAVWSGVGTYDLLYIINANQYGGAAGSGYSVESARVGLGAVPTSTLNLTTAISYFGMWWSAGDANNFLSFYSGNNLIASFSTATLLSRLPNTYFGNHTPGYVGADGSEAFAFINFYGTAGTTFDKIVLSDPSTTSGFESDNHTIRVAAYGQDPHDTSPTFPGVPVEEIRTTNGVQTVITDVTQINSTPQPVPEPGTASLLGLAGVAALWRTIKQRR